MGDEYSEGMWGRVYDARRDAPYHLMVESNDYLWRESACRGRESNGWTQPGRQLADTEKCGACVELIKAGRFPGVELSPDVV